MSQDSEDAVPGHIAAWSGEPGPRRVLEDAFARFQRGQAVTGGASELELSQTERQQVGRVLPATWAVSDAPLRWRTLRSGLLANDTTLESVVVHRCGQWRNQLQDRRDLRRETDQDREKASHTLTSLLKARIDVQELSDFTVAALTRGLFGRHTSNSDAVLIRRTLVALPATHGSVGLAVLAARVFSDAHALDRTTSLGRAVARFIRLEDALRAGRPTLDTAAGFTPQGWRSAWAGVGVVCDQVSSNVLVLNLPLVGDASAVAITTAAPGEPVWLTLRSLAGALSIPEEVPVIFVCENPSIVEAAADSLGAGSGPLICTYGRPSAAALQLLEAVGPRTAIRVQADADATGRAIVEALVAHHPTAAPWRMPETGVVYEEELVAELLADLRSS